MKKTYIKNFSEISLAEIPQFGGKNASLGELFRELSPKGLHVPKGFAISVDSYSLFLQHNSIAERLSKLMETLDTKDYTNLAEVGQKARTLILTAKIPAPLKEAIINAYNDMFENGVKEVAVRSSATAEDLPDASFAGQHESYLNIKGHKAVLDAVKNCYASLYTDRAIKYREDKGFEHSEVLLSVGIQEMVRSDLGCSGVGFTIEPESGFSDVIHLAAVWGLGENIVQGTVSPDEYFLFKPSLKKGLKSIIQQKLGSKTKTMVYSKDKNSKITTINIDTKAQLREQFALNNQEIELLGKWALLIEEHYGKPMDFEWAKDGISKQLYIVQARPETVHGSTKAFKLTNYQLKGKGEVLASGQAVGKKIISGRARILFSPTEIDKLLAGDILVTDATSPDWDPILKKVSGIITNQGGRTSHAAIIARELGAVAIVGCGNATQKITDGEIITINCSEGGIGQVLKGEVDWEESIIDLHALKMPEFPKAQLIVSAPESAFLLSQYPSYGVGLLRLEFMINNHIGIHPMALLNPDKLSVLDKRKVKKRLAGYADGKKYFIEKLSQGVGMIAAAFYPREVIVRMSDFKSNEYRGLIGGTAFEPVEENPMIGFRGASRYYHNNYKPGFELECEAIRVARDEMGLDNIKLMIPFCRTVEEGKRVIALMETCGLVRGKNGLEIFVMAEIPSNVLLAEEFAEVFDGFSIGSNDLTQLTLGIDRDSALVADLFDEQNDASKMLIINMIEKAKKLGKHIGLCGQAPSDSESFAEMLVEHDIDSIAFNPDSLIKGIELINKARKKMQIEVIN